MLKISGLDQLSRQLHDAQKALENLDGEIGSVSFDPNDPASIEAAIQHVETLVDEKAGSYANNPIIGPIIESMKQQYREGIINRAAAARLESEE